MKIESFMLADSAEVDGWLVNIKGAGWTHYACNEPFPSVVRGSIAGIATLEEDELERDKMLEFRIFTANDTPELAFKTDMTYKATTRVMRIPGVPELMPIAVPFEFGIEDSRVMCAVVSQNGKDLASATFIVWDFPPSHTRRGN
jgi:hypothetical protein